MPSNPVKVDGAATEAEAGAAESASNAANRSSVLLVVAIVVD